MKKVRLNYSILILLLMFVCFPVHTLAETIVFKSGKIINEKIIEKTDQHIRVNFEGTLLVYRLEDIESIDGERIDFKPAQPSKFEPLSQGIGIVENEGKVEGPLVDEKYSVNKRDETGAYYTNKEYGLTVWHPGDWAVSDRNTNQDFFKALLADKPPNMGDIICVLAYGNTRDPGVILAVAPYPLRLINLPAENLVEVIRQSLRNSRNTTLGNPYVVVVNGKKFVKVENREFNPKLKYAYYNFVRGAKIYTIFYGVKPSDFNTYEPVFDKIIGSITITPITRADRFFYNSGPIDLGGIAGTILGTIIVIIPFIFIWARSRPKRSS